MLKNYMKMKQKKSSEQEMNKEELKDQSANVADVKDATADSSREEKSSEDLQVKIAELNDKLLRLYSEFDNYRKRTIKEKIESSKTASEDVIRDLLPVMDDFERAMKSMESTDNIDSVKEGITLIFLKFKNTLTSKGLQEIKSFGEPFNTDYQEAIANIPAPSEELKNKVVDELQKGYTLNEKVIRFAKVVVGS